MILRITTPADAKTLVELSKQWKKKVEHNAASKAERNRIAMAIKALADEVAAKGT